MKAEARPLLRAKRTTWCTPQARATAAVPSVEPSSITSSSIDAIPGSAVGSAATVTGSVAASL